MTLIDASNEWSHICLLITKQLFWSKELFITKQQIQCNTSLKKKNRYNTIRIKLRYIFTNVCICEIANSLLKPKQCMYTIYTQESPNYITWSIVNDSSLL